MKLNPSTNFGIGGGRRTDLANNLANLGVTHWFDAKDILTGTEQLLPNRLNPGGNSLTFGSTAGADTNDPTRLARPGGSYVWFPGTAGNQARTTVDLATGSAVVTSLVSHKLAHGSGSQNLWQTVGSVGTSRLYVSTGGATIGVTFTRDSDGAALAVPVGGYQDTDLAHKVEVEWDFNGINIPRVRLYGALEAYPVAPVWILRGSADALVPVRRVAGSASLTLGNAAAASVHGSVVRAYVQNDNNVPRTDMNVTTQIVSSTSVGSWALERSATGLKTALVTRPVILPDGTDDYGQLPGIHTPTTTGATGQWTQLVAGYWSRDSTTTAFRAIYSTQPSGSTGYNLNQNALVTSGTPRMSVSGVSGVDCPGPSLSDGEPFVIGFVHDTGFVRSYRYGYGLSGGSINTTAAALSHTAPRLCSPAFSAITAGMPPLVATTGGPVALTVDQLDAIAARLLAGDYA